MNTLKTAPPPRKNYRAVKQESPLILTRAPHIRSSQTVASRMWTLILVLLPVIGGAIFVHGLNALWLLLHSAISAVTFELIAEKMFKRPLRIFDGSALLIGLVMGLSLPTTASWWMIWIGSFYAVFFARELAGGLGRNRFHPALFGLAVLYFLYPVVLDHELPIAANGFSSIAILASGTFLIWKRLIHWQNSLTYLAVVIGSSLILGQSHSLDLFTGSLLFAGFFIITDSVTSPLTIRGEMIFAACAGGLTGILGVLTGPPEAMIFAILIMNAWTRFIDSHVTMKVFGTL